MALDAGQVARQASRVREQVQGFNKTGSEMLQLLIAISEEVKAEDSNLASTIMETHSVYEKMRTCIEIKFNELADVMDKWVNSTVKNEQMSSEAIHNISNQLK